MRRLSIILAGFMATLTAPLACRPHVDFEDSPTPLHTPGASEQLYEKPAGAIRFVQYNVGAFCKYKQDSSSDVAAILKALGADVVGMNELDSINRRNNVYQMKMMAETRMGGDWEWHYFRAIEYRNGSYGNGVMTKASHILSTWGHFFPVDPGSEPRSMCVAETSDFVAISAHLDNSTANSAILAVKELNKVVSEKYGGTDKLVVLMTDSNTRPSTDAMKEMLKYWTLAGTDNRFDHVLVFNNNARYKTVGSASVTRSNAGDLSAASDHLPVYADIVKL